MIINCAKLDPVETTQVVLWLKANGCDYHTPINGIITLRGGWIETPVIEKFHREHLIKFTEEGIPTTGTKRFRHRHKLSEFRARAEELNADLGLTIKHHTRKPVEKIKIGSEYGLQRLFEMFGGAFAVDRS